LQEKGIGRPSTFSSIISKIQERKYVKRENIKGKEIEGYDYEFENGKIIEIKTNKIIGNENNKLVIQKIGIDVIEFLNKYFSEIFNYDYTKKMEDELDRISNGNKVWYELCKLCDISINELINNIQFLNNSKINKETLNLSSINNDNNDNNDINNDICNNNNDISNNNNDINNNNNKSIQINKNEYKLGKYEGNDVILKKGKFGLFLVCGDINKTLKQLGNRPIESIMFEDVYSFLLDGSNIVRKISDNITIRKGKNNDYIFFKNTKIKKPLFYNLDGFDYDYKLCDLNLLKIWIYEKYNIF
jgi:DNA topoisomerase-1